MSKEWSLAIIASLAVCATTMIVISLDLRSAKAELVECQTDHWQALALAEAIGREDVCPGLYDRYDEAVEALMTCREETWEEASNAALDCQIEAPGRNCFLHFSRADMYGECSCLGGGGPGEVIRWTREGGIE